MYDKKKGVNQITLQNKQMYIFYMNTHAFFIFYFFIKYVISDTGQDGHASS